LVIKLGLFDVGSGEIWDGGERLGLDTTDMDREEDLIDLLLMKGEGSPGCSECLFPGEVGNGLRKRPG